MSVHLDMYFCDLWHSYEWFVTKHLDIIIWNIISHVRLWMACSVSSVTYTGWQLSEDYVLCTLAGLW